MKAAMSIALPKACSEIPEPPEPTMPRQEYAEICLISVTGVPNQRIAAGCTPSLTQWSSAETIGQARVAGGVRTAGVIGPAVCRPRADPSDGTVRCGGW